MSDPINMLEIVKELPSRPRGKACIVFTHDYAGQKDWAEQLADMTGSDHINLLELFAGDDSLSEDLSRLTVPAFFDFLKSKRSAPVLIVSGLEFLKATWAGLSNAAEEFASRVETWRQSPCLLFVMQHDREIAERPFRRYEHTVVIDQRETLKL